MRRRISRTQSVRNWLWQSGTRTQICKSRNYQLWNILYLLKLSSSSCSVSCSLYCVYLYLIFGPLNFRKTKRFVITLTKKSYSGENKKMEKKGHLFLQLATQKGDNLRFYLHETLWEARSYYLLPTPAKPKRKPITWFQWTLPEYCQLLKLVLKVQPTLEQPQDVNLKVVDWQSIAETKIFWERTTINIKTNFARTILPTLSGNIVVISRCKRKTRSWWISLSRLVTVWQHGSTTWRTRQPMAPGGSRRSQRFPLLRSS